MKLSLSPPASFPAFTPQILSPIPLVGEGRSGCLGLGHDASPFEAIIPLLIRSCSTKVWKLITLCCIKPLKSALSVSHWLPSGKSIGAPRALAQHTAGPSCGPRGSSCLSGHCNFHVSSSTPRAFLLPSLLVLSSLLCVVFICFKPDVICYLFYKRADQCSPLLTLSYQTQKIQFSLTA